jgi:hypothetical protein
MVWSEAAEYKSFYSGFEIHGDALHTKLKLLNRKGRMSIQRPLLGCQNPSKFARFISQLKNSALPPKGYLLNDFVKARY